MHPAAQYREHGTGFGFGGGFVEYGIVNHHNGVRTDHPASGMLLRYDPGLGFSQKPNKNFRIRIKEGGLVKTAGNDGKFHAGLFQQIPPAG